MTKPLDELDDGPGSLRRMDGGLHSVFTPIELMAISRNMAEEGFTEFSLEQAAVTAADGRVIGWDLTIRFRKKA